MSPPRRSASRHPQIYGILRTPALHKGEIQEGKKGAEGESEPIISVLGKFLRRPDARLLEKTSSSKQKSTGISSTGKKVGKERLLSVSLCSLYIFFSSAIVYANRKTLGGLLIYRENVF